MDESLLTVDSHIALLPVHEAPQQTYQIVAVYRRDNANPALRELLTTFPTV